MRSSILKPAYICLRFVISLWLSEFEIGLSLKETVCRSGIAGEIDKFNYGP